MASFYGTMWAEPEPQKYQSVLHYTWSSAIFECIPIRYTPYTHYMGNPTVHSLANVNANVRQCVFMLVASQMIHSLVS